MTGWRERTGELPEFLLARAGVDGRLRPAGSTSFGLDAGQRAELLEALAGRELPRRRSRGRVRWAAPGVEVLVQVLVDAHGSPSGSVRDAILRGLGVTMSPEDVVTVADIARILKLNSQTVRNWIADGSLPAMHVGRRVRCAGAMSRR